MMREKPKKWAQKRGYHGQQHINDRNADTGK